jgi:hypothetical protein
MNVRRGCAEPTDDSCPQDGDESRERMPTRDSKRRELKELARLGETLRTDRVADARSSGEWLCPPPDSLNSTPATHAADPASAAPVGSTVGITSSGVKWTASALAGSGRLESPSPQGSPRRSGPLPWMLAIGAAVLVVGGAVVTRSMGIHRVPVAVPIVVATQAPAAVALAPPQGAAEPPIAETTMPVSDRTETTKPDVPAAGGSASASSPRTTDRGVSQGPPQGKKSVHAPERASGGPAVPAKSSAAPRTQGAAGGKPSLEDLIRQSVRGSASK